MYDIDIIAIGDTITFALTRRESTRPGQMCNINLYTYAWVTDHITKLVEYGEVTVFPNPNVMGWWAALCLNYEEES